MDRNAKTYFGVPTKENVDYSKIYEFNTNAINPKELFTPYLRNRGGREDAIAKHILEIKDGILKSGGFGKFPPIIVDINTLQIVDGNCRFNAILAILDDNSLSNIALKVIFEDINEEVFDERVIQLNMNQKPWNMIDFIYNYKLRGYESYGKLIDFCMSDENLHTKEGKINPRYAAAALNVPNNSLKNSKLYITDADIERGHKVIKEAAEIRKRFSPDNKANGGGWYEPYLKAWSEFRNTLGDIPFNDYLKEVNKSIKYRKKEVKVPYGSNRKADWNGFFRTIKTYIE